jgi:Domain of unknown function (DUF4360)
MPALFTLAAVSALVALPLTAPVPPAVAAGPSAPPGITLLNVTGSGCRPNTTSAAFSPDATALTITYSSYVLVAGGSTRTMSKDCRINLKIDAVKGYAPTITSVDYRGFVDLAAASRADLSATYGFHGAARLETAALRLTGAMSDNWQTTDTAEAGLVTGKCKGSHVLDVDSTLSLTSSAAGAATDYLAMDSTDGVVPNTLHVTWTPCS